MLLNWVYFLLYNFSFFLYYFYTGDDWHRFIKGSLWTVSRKKYNGDKIYIITHTGRSSQVYSGYVLLNVISISSQRSQCHHGLCWMVWLHIIGFVFCLCLPFTGILDTGDPSVPSLACSVCLCEISQCKSLTKTLYILLSYNASTELK